MRGGRGAGLDANPATTAKRGVRRPLHHASHGSSPPPLSRGRMSGTDLAAQSRASVVKQPTIPVVIARSGSDEAIQSGTVKSWIASLALAMTKERIRKRNAGRRTVVSPAPAGAVAPRKGRLAPTRPLSGALACRRSTTALAKESISSPRRDPGQASWEAASTGRASLRRRRSHFQRCTSRAGHSAGRLMPEPPECAADEATPAGTALAPLRPASPGRRPLGRDLILWYCI